MTTKVIGAFFLLTLIYQDFKSRQISWVLLPLLLVVLFYQQAVFNDWPHTLKNIGINFGFIAIQLALLTLYFSVKNKKLTWVFDTLLGWGDVLLLLVMCVAFSPLNFILFYMLSLLAGIFVFLVSKKSSTIPLAGIISALLLLVWASDLLWPSLNVYNDYWIETMLYHG